MALPSPKFEDGQLWDGTTPNSRPTTEVFKHPDGEIGNRHSAEIVALEKLLNNVTNVIQLLKNPGAANSILGVLADTTGLEYKILIQGGGITISHGAGTITISASGVVQLGAEADVQIKIGNPLYLKANTHVATAKADDASTVQVAGLAISNAAPTFTCNFVTEGQVERADWTDITGAVTLTPGATYFLDAVIAGKITTVAPTTTGQYVVRVGRAIDTTTLDIEIELPIRL